MHNFYYKFCFFRTIGNKTPPKTNQTPFQALADRFILFLIFPLFSLFYSKICCYFVTRIFWHCNFKSEN